MTEAPLRFVAITEEQAQALRDHLNGTTQFTTNETGMEEILAAYESASTCLACPTCGSLDHGPRKRRVYLCLDCGKRLDPEKHDHKMFSHGLIHADCGDAA